jgi:hypothetical protein
MRFVHRRALSSYGSKGGTTATSPSALAVSDKQDGALGGEVCTEMTDHRPARAQGCRLSYRVALAIFDAADWKRAHAHAMHAVADA